MCLALAPGRLAGQNKDASKPAVTQLPGGAWRERRHEPPSAILVPARRRRDGAVPEPNRPSRGLHDRTGLGDPRAHFARAESEGEVARSCTDSPSRGSPLIVDQ